MSRRQVIAPDWTWIEDRLEAGLQVTVNGAGRIEKVGRLGLEPTHRLRGRALFPGMVNVHSHAFQRRLRGRGEHYPAGTGSFWTWREVMYDLAGSLDAEGLHRVTLQTFQEMRRAGITSVGEFHYLHHASQAQDFALDSVVLEAAKAAGIRLVLLNAYYTQGGIGRSLSRTQRGFHTVSPGTYWRQMDTLASQLEPGLQTLGAAVHSIRAATLEEIVEVHREAERRGLVFHMHVEEQRREVDESVAAYGKPPMALLNEELEITPRFTAVHATHTTAADLEQFLASGGRACICPLTEASLGDGLADVEEIHRLGGRISLGTDSNHRISMLEEMRWLEYGQRLAREARGVLRNEGGRVGRELWKAATVHGADSLGLPAGRIEPGLWADFVAIGLGSPLLEGWEPDTLLDALVFGTSEEVIAATCVGGRWEEHRGG